MSNLQNPLYDDVTADVIGPIGRWQIIVTFLVSLTVIPYTLNTYSELYISQSSSAYQCMKPFRETDQDYNPCFVNNGTFLTKCTEWQIMLFGSIKLKRNWLLICQSKQNVFFLSIISRVGLATGSVITGRLADWIGRKRMLMVSLGFQFPLGILAAFGDSGAWFCFLHFVYSVTSSSTAFVGIIIICEIIGNKWRSKVICLGTLPYCIGLSITVPLAHALPNLATQQLIASIISPFILLLMWYVPESPTWLLYNDKEPQAEAVIAEAAHKNNIIVYSEFKIRPVDHNVYNILETHEGCKELLSKRESRKVTAVIMVVWFSASFLWGFLLLFDIDNVKWISEAQFVFYGLLAAICGWVLPGMFFQRVPHYYMLLIMIPLTATFSIITYYTFDSVPSRARFFKFMAVMSSRVSLCSLINLTPRLFSLNMRGTLFGCCMALSQLGVIAGYAVYWYNVFGANLASLVMLLIICVVIALLGAVLPKVEGRELPDVIDDMNDFKKKHKPLRWACQRMSNVSSIEEIELRNCLLDVSNDSSRCNSTVSQMSRARFSVVYSASRIQWAIRFFRSTRDAIRSFLHKF